MLRRRWADAAFVAAALLIALAVKAFYSRAGASELAFVLTPSCWIAAHLGGVDLVAEEGAGFISHAHRMVVGPACAGVNFLIIAFLAVYLSRRLAAIPSPLSRLRETGAPSPLSRLRERVGVRVRDEVRGLLIAAVVAYVATILTNGLRIILAAHLFQLGGIGWFTPERVHRLAGVVIYLVALVVMCWGLARDRRSVIIALACYLGVAVGLPLVNGAARNRLFVEHALVVTAASLLVVAIAHAAMAGASWSKRRKV